jgi:hypothetical protein
MVAVLVLLGVLCFALIVGGLIAKFHGKPLNVRLLMAQTILVLAIIFLIYCIIDLIVAFNNDALTITKFLSLASMICIIISMSLTIRDAKNKGE